MRIRIPRQLTDYAASIGLMTVFLVGSLAVCAAPLAISAALLH
jgi:hypothetical protein